MARRTTTVAEFSPVNLPSAAAARPPSCHRRDCETLCRAAGACRPGARDPRARRREARARQDDHAPRVDAARPPGAPAGRARGAAAARGGFDPHRHQRRARRGQVDLHRDARPASDRARPPRRGACGRSVEQRVRRLDPRRQDADGAPVAVDPNAFIRPSPVRRRRSAASRARPREALLVCEAAASTSSSSRRSASDSRRPRSRGMTDCFVLVAAAECGRRPAGDQAAGSSSSPTSSP